ncbi:MAG TPA: hypothetical protein VNO43_06985 [Candidatus Eisenbacteria bacterium]|nr:hypothetical protein [Candidatus Eisenbacteria bacterium]
MKQFTVELTPEAFKMLGDHLHKQAILVSVWREVGFILDENQKPVLMVVSCDEKEIEALLCIAALHYPEALPTIQKSIDRSRSAAS